MIQASPAHILYCSIVVKKFLPGETRTWKVFLLDVSKQIFTAGFAHFLNLVLAVYLQDLTREGNGCVWYLVTLLCDTTLGIFFAYVFFKIVDEVAIKFDIEVLKSGVYTDKEVPVDADDDFDPDEEINFRTWLIQVIVWCMCTMLSKFFVFFAELIYHKELISWGIGVLYAFKDHPKLELVVVMVFLPSIFQSLMFWIQDAFLKGDKHMDARRIEQEEKRRQERAARRELNYNMGKGNLNVQAAADMVSDHSEEDS